MPPRTDTRQRFIDAAADLFHRQGYHATGLNQLVSAGGAPKGSFYFHFPDGKEQLAAEALTHSADRLRESLVQALRQGGIDAVFATLQTTLVESDYRQGCPMATVALDAGSESEQIRESCAAGFESWRQAIEEFLLDQGVTARRAGELATVGLAMLEGALLLARTRRDPTPLHLVADQLRTILEQELN